jgi:general secretion pathway protein G
MRNLPHEARFRVPDATLIASWLSKGTPSNTVWLRLVASMGCSREHTDEHHSPDGRHKKEEIMFARIRSVREKESGFTLIELLIVIVILGVLSGIVVFSVAGITSRGKAEACKATVATVQTAGEAYYAKNGSYAASTAILTSSGFLQPPALGVADVTYTVIAGPPASMTVTAGTTGSCAP